MRKQIAMLLTLTFVIPTIPAYAKDNIETNHSIFIEAMQHNAEQAEENEIVHTKSAKENSLEKQVINYYVLPQGNIAEFYEDDEGFFFSGTTATGTETQGKVNISEDETICLDIQSGEIQNEVVLSNDGSIYLDGNEVTFSYVIEDTNGEALKEDRLFNSTTRQASDRGMERKCPYGKSSDYSVYKYTVKMNDIVLGKALNKIAEAALSTIILSLAAVFEAKTGTYGFMTPGLVMDTIAVIMELVDIFADTEMLSCETKVYYHKNGHVVGNLLTVHKEVKYWYGQPACVGIPSGPDISYAWQQFY